MLKSQCRIIIQKDENGRIRKALIYVPLEVANDSQFPFGESVVATIDVNSSKKEITVLWKVK